MLVIGITGPTGCGKTTLLREIEHRGGYIVDCDALYYALLASEEGAALRQELQAAFPAAFDADGTLRRKALGRLVFGDPSRMAQLNEIVFFHVGNAVRARLVHEQSAGRQLFAVDAINLFESGLAALCDTTVGVLAGRETRIARIMARDGLTREYAALRVDAQKPDSFYEAHCNIILQNAGTREAFARTADQYLTNILKGAFPMTKQEREALLYQPKHGHDRLTKEDEAAMLTYCEDYKAFLDRSKTERECVVSAVELAEKAGFRELTAGMALKAGDKVYSVNRGKSILLAVIGKRPLSEGANIGAAHTDAPRLDFKPNPLYEDAELAYIKTHHYGGIRKYQWVTVPLELHGKVVRADGSEIFVKIGANDILHPLLPDLKEWFNSSGTRPNGFTPTAQDIIGGLQDLINKVNAYNAANGTNIQLYFTDINPLLNYTRNDSLIESITTSESFDLDNQNACPFALLNLMDDLLDLRAGVNRFSGDNFLVDCPDGDVISFC